MYVPWYTFDCNHGAINTHTHKHIKLKSLNQNIHTYSYFVKELSWLICSGWKLCIRNTLNLSMCMDSNNDTKVYVNIYIYFMKQNCIPVICVTCHLSNVTSHLTTVTCHLSPVTNANSHRPYSCILPHYAQYAGSQKQNTHINK